MKLDEFDDHRSKFSRGETVRVNICDFSDTRARLNENLNGIKGVVSDEGEYRERYDSWLYYVEFNSDRSGENIWEEELTKV